jgi:hypothetical protein
VTTNSTLSISDQLLDADSASETGPCSCQMTLNLTDSRASMKGSSEEDDQAAPSYSILCQFQLGS